MKKYAMLVFIVWASVARADVALPIGSYCNIAIGLEAMPNCTTCSRVIVIGAHSGKTITNERDIILIGNYLDIPKAGMNGYVNIGGKEYKRSEIPDIRALIAKIWPGGEGVPRGPAETCAIADEKP